MMEGIGKGLGEILIGAIIVAAVLFGGGTWIASKMFYDADHIESDTIIVPEIKLTINANQVDTIYVYKRKK